MTTFFERLARRLGGYVLDTMWRDDGIRSAVVQRWMLRIATTPTLFGGAWDRVVLGNNVKLVNALLNVTAGAIHIGDDTFFGHNVCLLTGTHPVKNTFAERHAHPTSGRDIVIGRGVWVASNATILGPCTIEDHVVVAAGSVVTGGTLESGCLYAGVPARRIKKLEIPHEERS